jgi:hypothetical protein
MMSAPTLRRDLSLLLPAGRSSDSDGTLAITLAENVGAAESSPDPHSVLGAKQRSLDEARELVPVRPAGTSSPTKSLQTDAICGKAVTSRSPAYRGFRTGFPPLLKIVVSPVRVRVSPFPRNPRQDWASEHLTPPGNRTRNTTISGNQYLFGTFWPPGGP